MPKNKQYKANILIEIVREILPASAAAWKNVALLYQARSGEQLLRDPDYIKRHWYEKLCNKGMKPTGSSGGPNDRIHV